MSEYDELPDEWDVMTGAQKHEWFLEERAYTQAKRQAEAQQSEPESRSYRVDDELE